MQFKYNILSGLLIVLSGCNLGLLYLDFGLGDQLSVFFLIITSITLIQMFITLPFQQFVFIHNRYNAKNSRRSNSHYSLCLFISMIISALIGLVVINYQSFFISLLIPNLQNNLMDFTKELFEIAILSIFVSTPLMIAQQKINSLGKIVHSYLISFLPILFQLVILIYIYFNHLDINFVVWFLVGGNFCAFALAVVFTRKSLSFLDRKCLAYIKPLFKESFRVKFAHNIHNFAFLYFINSFASGLQTNLSSLLFLVKRLADSLQQIIVGPLLRILPTSYAKLIDCDQQDLVFNDAKKLSKVNIIFYSSMMSVLLIGLFVFQEMISLDEGEIKFVYLCILGFLTFSLIICLETPYAIISMAFGKSMSFYVSNTIFSMVMLSTYLSLDSFDSYTPIFCALVFAQMLVLIINRHFAKYYLEKLKF